MEEIIKLLGLDLGAITAIALLVFVVMQVLKAAGWAKIMPGGGTDERMSRLTLLLSLIFAFLNGYLDGNFDAVTAENAVSIVFNGLISGLVASLFYKQVAKRFAGLYYSEDILKGDQDDPASG